MPPVSEVEKLSFEVWEAGFQAFKETRNISAVQRAVRCGFAIARALVKDGCPARNWPAYEVRVREEEEYERRVKAALAASKDDERIEYLTYKEMYRNLRDGAATFLKTNGKQGVEPKRGLVQGVQDLMDLAEDLRRKQREMLNLIVLPFEDMTEEELAEWSKGKKRPRR